MPVEFPARLPDSVAVDGAALSGRWLVDGAVRHTDGETAAVTSPVLLDDGAALRAPVLGHVPMLTADEALEALHAAQRAWDGGRGVWPSMRVGQRIGHVERFLDGLMKVREVVVRLLMVEIAKSRKDAEAEFDRTVTYIRDTLEALKDVDRQNARFVIEDGFLGQIRRSPLGVVLCMGPFNYPLNETYATLIPALLMGNTVVSKVPRFGQLAHVPIFEAMIEAFPPGVVNVVFGDGATTIGPIMASGGVDVLAFIGTSRVANLLKRQHPRPNRLRSITGLEAKNPAIVLPDADLDLAVRECVSGALSYNGQRCTALKLLLVHEEVAPRFVEALADAVSRLTSGMPWEPGVAITPLPEPGKPEWLRGMVDDAVAKGASVVNAAGGASHGTWFAPAVVYPVVPSARLYAEEQFGPVVPVATFRDDAEIPAFLAASHYGQQVSLFGADPRRVASLVDAMVNQVSRINLNTQCRRGPDTFPFTGRKDSAEGTLSVSDALRAFSIRAAVVASASEANKELVGEIVARRHSAFLSTDFLF